MGYILEKVMLWGRSFEEYSRFFSLDEKDMDRHILSCADGPSGFNAGMTKRGKNCVSVDPIYRFSENDIENRINGCAVDIMKQVNENTSLFQWHLYKSPENLKKERLRAMSLFLADYDEGLKEGRYITNELPLLDFPGKPFGLVLCSHFLFTYSHHLNFQFHLDSITEMLRIGDEVRIFPVLHMDRTRSVHFDRIIEYFNNDSTLANLQKVDYEFQVRG